jgi:hypothetical protein
LDIPKTMKALPSLPSLRLLVRASVNQYYKYQVTNIVEFFDKIPNVRRSLNNKNGLNCRITKEANVLKVS